MNGNIINKMLRLVLRPRPVKLVFLDGSSESTRLDFSQLVLDLIDEIRANFGEAKVPEHCVLIYKENEKTGTNKDCTFLTMTKELTIESNQTLRDKNIPDNATLQVKAKVGNVNIFA